MRAPSSDARVGSPTYSSAPASNASTAAASPAASQSRSTTGNAAAGPALSDRQREAHSGNDRSSTSTSGDSLSIMRSTDTAESALTTFTTLEASADAIKPARS